MRLASHRITVFPFGDRLRGIIHTLQLPTQYAAAPVQCAATLTCLPCRASKPRRLCGCDHLHVPTQGNAQLHRAGKRIRGHSCSFGAIITLTSPKKRILSVPEPKAGKLQKSGSPCQAFPAIKTESGMAARIARPSRLGNMRLLEVVVCMPCLGSSWPIHGLLFRTPLSLIPEWCPRSRRSFANRCQQTKDTCGVQTISSALFSNNWPFPQSYLATSM